MTETIAPDNTQLDSKEHIALFSATLGGGGAERVMVTLANGLLRKNYQVDMVLVQKIGPYLSELEPGVRIVDLAAGRASRAFWPLVRYLRNIQPTVILSTQRRINLLAILARRAARIDARVVIRETNTTSAATPNKTTDLNRLFLSYLYRKFCPMADAIIAPSYGVANDMIYSLGLHQKQINVIPNPLPLTAIQKQAAEPLDHPWFSPNSQPVILGVGSLSKQKDFFTLMKAFAKVIKQRQANLMILGDGEMRPQLENLAESLGVDDRVLMPGFVTNPFNYMRRASVYVLSSRWEGLPNVLLQAIAVGAPVVATDCPSGPREILDDGQWGKLVPVGDVDAMADAIVEGIDRKIKLVPMSIVAQRYDVDVVVGHYTKVLMAANGG